MRKFIIFGDAHACPEESNERADYLAALIIEEKPDVVVDLGDGIDFGSLSSYDKGKRSFHGRSYKADIESYLDFQERVWEPVKARKKKLPYSVRLIGNHEQRVERALDLSPELSGTIGIHDLKLEDYYDEIVPYNGGSPGIIEIDGILFSHFFPTGVSGRPISGERPAHMLLDKTGHSCVAGHIHVLDYACRKSVSGRTRMGLINGTYSTHIPQWAGTIGQLWKPGLSILHDVHDGQYDFEFVSLDRMKRMYG